jgi:hypothetical protein
VTDSTDLPPAPTVQVFHGGRDCSVAEYRELLSENDFWAHVLTGTTDEPEPYDADLDGITSQNDPCPECGETGPCGYDMEGRPMIHITETEDKDDE